MSIPNGARVIGVNDFEGRVVGREQHSDGTIYASITLRDGRSVLVPENELIQQSDGVYRLTTNQTDIASFEKLQANQTETIVVPVIAEELSVGKREVEQGRVRINKTVETREEHVEVPLIHSSVDVERVAINQIVETAPQVRQEGDTIVVPVLEEVLVVEKRLVLREELRITRKQTTTTSSERVVLRRENVEVERIPAQERLVHSDNQK